MKKFVLHSAALIIYSFIIVSCSNSPTSVENQNVSTEDQGGFFSDMFSNSDDIDFVTVNDPKENAFKVNLPRGWQNQIALVRRGNQTRNHGVSVSPDGKTKLFFGDPSIPYYSLPIAEYGMHEGMQTGDPLLQVRNHIPAEKYFPSYVNQQYSNRPGFRITGVNPNQKVVTDWENEIQKNGIQAKISACDVHFEFQDGNTKKQGKIQGVVFLLAQGWGADCNGYITETSEQEKASKCLAELTSSFKVNPQWQEKENKMVSQKMNNDHQQRMQNQQASFNAHQQKMQGRYAASDAQFNNYMSQSRANDQSHQNYMNQQYSNDRSHENFIDNIRGEQRVTNGDQYGKVESGYNNYYVNESTGDYFGTDVQMDVAPDNYEKWENDF
ncbi:MAG: hypothetical protein WED33_02085 [Bacteroidia bacterium]